MDRSFEGLKSLKITDTDNMKAVGMRSTSIAAAPGRFYDGNAYCYVSSGSASFYIEFWDSSGTRLAENHTVLSTTGSWTKVEASGFAPAGTVSVTLMCYSTMANTGTCYFDRVTLDDTIPNNSFESADGNDKPLYWAILTGTDYYGDAEVSMDMSYGGLKSLKITDTDDMKGVAVRSANIAAVPGSFYVGNAYCYVSSGFASFYIEFWDGSGTRLAENHTVLSSKDSWIKVEASGIAPEATASVTLMCYSPMTNMGTCYFDLITLDK